MVTKIKLASRLTPFIYILVFCLFGLSLFVAGTAVPAQATSDMQMIDGLVEKAAENGAVRVIVQLNVPFHPEGELPGMAAAQNQQAIIETIQDIVLEQIAGTNSSVVADYQYIPYLALEVDGAALAILATLPQVTGIIEDNPVPPTLASSIPIIGADEAWSAGYTGAGQTVVILDTGVALDHPAFTTGGNRIVSEACYSTTSAPYSATSVCPGGVSESTAVGAGNDCVATVGAGNPTAQSNCEHGTHVAGIAAGNDGGANIGVAKGADIIAMQIFSLFNSVTYCGGYSDCMLTFSSDQILALERVYELRNDFTIASVNMSLGGGQYFSACDGDGRKAAIDNLRSVGIATIIASGNSGYKDSMGAPACISSAISVGATTDSDNVASYSNIASFIDLLAPGSSITAPVPGGTGVKSGTSMATPHVTGAWAIYKEISPGASVDDVLNALRTTGTLIDDARSGGTMTDIPRVNIDLAINQFTPGLTTAVGASSNFIFPGETLTYTIQISNDTSITATNVLITNSIPAEVTLEMASLGGDASASGIMPGSVITWTTGATLNPGQALQRTFAVTVDSATTGETITNTTFASSPDMSEVRSDTAVTTIIQPAGCGLLDGFETGELSNHWLTAVSNDGRVRVLDTLPDSGSYHVVLDDAVAGGSYSEAALILTADLTNQVEVELAFKWHDLGDEYDPAYDGVFIRQQQGDTWIKVFDFSGTNNAAYQLAQIDLKTAAADNGLALTETFQIKFGFYDNFSFNAGNISGGDGYALDGVALNCVGEPQSFAVNPDALSSQILITDDGQLTITIPAGSLPANGVQLVYTPLSPDTPDLPPNSLGYAFKLELLDGGGQVIVSPVFDPPLQFALQYQPNQFPAGTVEDIITLSYDNPSTGEWEIIPITNLDTDGNMITVSLRHLSRFALTGPVQLFIPMVLK